MFWHFQKAWSHMDILFLYLLHLSPSSELLNNFHSYKKKNWKITLCLKCHLSSLKLCVCLLTKSDIPKAKCNANVICVWRQDASVIIILKYSGSLQSRTSAQVECEYPFVSQNKAKLQHFKQITWFRFDLSQWVCYRTGRVINFLTFYITNTLSNYTCKQK